MSYGRAIRYKSSCVRAFHYYPSRKKKKEAQSIASLQFHLFVILSDSRRTTNRLTQNWPGYIDQLIDLESQIEQNNFRGAVSFDVLHREVELFDDLFAVCGMDEF